MINIEKNKICVVTGSFDPISIGHKFLIEKAKEDFDYVYVLLLTNADKISLFTIEEKLLFINELFKGDKKIIIDSYDGIGIDYMISKGINIIVRGFRDSKDYAYEETISKFNRKYGNIDTFLVPAPNEIKKISSSKIREYLENDDERLKEYVPLEILELVKDIYKNKML